MPESLLNKYPHLKLLLSESREKRVNLADQKKDAAKTEILPDDMIAPPRKSILGPGVGPRIDRKPPVKTYDPNSIRRKVTAEELYNESLASDNDQWLFFQIEKVPASQQMEQLKMWLATNKPSQINRDSGIGWIAIKMTERSSKNLAAKEEWDKLEEEPTMETVNQIAAKHQVTGGKWLCHVTRDSIDRVWQKLAIAMFSGGLGPTVYMVKVSPAAENGKNEHVICVYNPNYQDVAQVMRVENLMRSAGVSTDLLYKPDIFSALGIYRNNKWGFRATIYSSRVMLTEGRSKISIAGSEKFYHNSSKGFESPQDLDNEKITAQITAAISKPSPRHTPAPGKAQQAEEALSVMVDMVEDSIKEGEDMKDGVKSKSPEKPHDTDLSSKLRELGLKNLDDLSKS